MSGILSTSDLPAAWWIEFHDPDPAHWWMRFTEKGFGHCSAFALLDSGWQVVDCVSDGLKVYWLDGRHDLVEFWRSRGALVLVANARARPLGNLRGPLTCVSVVKALLGVRGFSVTPFQLCRRLMEEHGGSVV